MNASTIHHPPSTIVVVGASQGGLSALTTLLAGLRPDFPLPVVIVQHRGKDSEETFCDFLRTRAGRAIQEARDKEPILPCAIYLAPPDYHLLIETDHFALSLDAPVNYARPSIDVLFESAAEARGPGVCAVVLTGTSADGAAGAARVKARGGRVLVQDPATAERRKMPEAVLAATRVDLVLPLADIGPALNQLAGENANAGAPADL